MKVRNWLLDLVERMTAKGMPVWEVKYDETYSHPCAGCTTMRVYRPRTMCYICEREMRMMSNPYDMD